MAAATKAKTEESWGDILKTVLQVLAVVLVIRTVAFEPFNIPSGSMIPTLLVGDYLFVSKYSYGYSRYSLPFWNPPVNGRLFGRLPARGDVAVFRCPCDTSIDYIKRVVGLPGDRVQVRGGQLYINDEAVPRVRGEDFLAVDERGGSELTHSFTETLPGGAVHRMLQRTDEPSLSVPDVNNTAVVTVPPGMLFVMGDNRTNSADSRVPPSSMGVGLLPVENLVGRAEFRFFSFDSTVPWWHVWEWPFAIRYSRLFSGVK